MSSMVCLAATERFVQPESDRPLRILIVTDAWKPQVNGVVRTLDTIAREAARRGHVVGLVSPDAFPTMAMPSYPEIRLALLPGRRLARMIAGFRPDCIHLATEGPLGWAARRWCLRRNIPFTTAYHTRFPEYLRPRLGVPLALSYAVMRRFHRPSAGVMVATRSIREALAARGFANLRPWTRGVDLSRFVPAPGRSALPPALAGLRRPVAAYVGRLAVEKNVEAFLAMPWEGTKLVVGDGPAMNRLRARHPEALFVGARHGDDLVRHFQAADVFVFPSLTDTFGLVILEALACGVPVAAYPVPGPIDVLSPAVGVTGPDLAAAARAALGLSPAACRSHALGFTWEATTDLFLQDLAPFAHPWPEQPLRGPAVSIPYRPRES